MTALSIAGLMLAGMGHALWNLLAKRSEHKLVFMILAVITGVLLMTPFALVRLGAPIPPLGWVCIVASGLIELIYYFLLGAAYTQGDMSLVYPIARGSSPVFVTLIAVGLSGEHLSWLGTLGIALGVLGVYILPLPDLSGTSLRAPLASLRRRAAQLALLNGLSIALYSTVDKQGVKLVDPIVYFWLVLCVSLIGLAPWLWFRLRQETLSEWRARWKTALAVGALITGGYVLILFILRNNPVSYATAVRSVSIVFGALLGVIVLKERVTAPRVLGSLVIFAGVVCIGLA